MSRRTAFGLLAAILLTGCGSWSDATSRTVTDALADQAAPVTPTTTAPPVAECDPHASYRPLDPLPQPGAMPAGSPMARIVEAGQLDVGVDENTLLLGYRDPASGELEGFEIDLAERIGKAIFGEPGHVVFATVTTKEKTSAVEDRTVDMTISAVSMTCDRWQRVLFSAPYFETDQRVMVRADSGIEDLSELAGKRICVTKGSTSLGKIEAIAPDVEPYEVDTRTECLAALQEGRTDAIFTHYTFLLGFRAQDPNTKILPNVLTETRYGIAINQDDEELVRFVNGVLEELRADGELQTMYDASFCAAITCGDPPVPPGEPVPDAPRFVPVPDPDYGRG